MPYFPKSRSIDQTKNTLILSTYHPQTNPSHLSKPEYCLTQSSAPNLHEFVDRLEKYQTVSSIVRNHTRSQASLLTEFWEHITYRIPIEDLGRIPDIIDLHTGK